MELAMKRTMKTSMALGLVAAMPLGCGAVPNDGSLDPAELSDDSAAVCTEPVWANTTFNLAAAVAGLTTSANASYGSTTCPAHFLVDLTNTTNRSFTSFADWGDTAAVPGNCGYHYVTARMDGLLPPTSTDPQGRWIAVTTDRTLAGRWVNGVCSNRVDLGAVQGLTPYSKVRIAARAFTTVGGDYFRFQTPAKVSVGFKQSTTPGY
jgi:hypothetical protein